MNELTSDLARLDAEDGPPVIGAARRGDAALSAPEHRHRRGQLIALRSGRLSVTADGARRLLASLHALWLPPLQNHSAQSIGLTDAVSVYFAEPLCARLPDRVASIRISGLLREAALRTSEWRDEAFDARRASVAEVMVDEIRSLQGDDADPALPMPQDARLLRIAEALAADPAEERRLEDWARWAGLSSRTLSRRFVAETGLTFSDWRQHARLLRADELLANGLSVTATAIELGYSNVGAFIALYRRTYGVTPGRRAES